MKWFVIIHLCLVAAIYGCRDAKPVMIQEFIPGTYIRFSSHEFGSEYDTVSISVLNISANEYGITRRWKYERIGLPPHYELTNSSGIYYPREKVLQDLESGDMITFGVKEKCLFIGTTKYQKL
jgi:hypothetical protein